MPQTELLIPLAEIAGVFVGFGALIAVRSGGPTEATEVAPMRMVVAMGMLTVVAALVPGSLARFDLGEHNVWAIGSAVILAGWLVMLVASLRTPEYRTSWESEIRSSRVRSRAGWLELLYWAVYVVYLLASLVTPVVILLGVAPGLEAALYYAVVLLILIGAGWTLLSMVFAQRLPART